MKKHDFVVEVSFHLGELYFIVPLLYHIYRRRAWFLPRRLNDSCQFCLLFTSRIVWQDFQRDVLLRRAIDEIQCEIICNFDEGQASAEQRREACMEILVGAPLLLSHIGPSYAKALVQRDLSSVVRVILFPHTSSPALFNLEEARRTKPKNRGAQSSVVLVRDPASAEYHRLQGLHRSIVVGYHELARPWRSFVSRTRRREHHGTIPGAPFGLVFSYGVREDVLTPIQWASLHLTTYQVIRRVVPNMKVVFKPHPTQREEPLIELIERYEMIGAEISTGNSQLLAASCSFAVSFLTGGIFNAIYAGKPSINYFNGRDTYESFHGGFKHDYGALGIADVDNESDLEAWLRTARDDRASIRFTEEKSKIKRIETRGDLMCALLG